MKLDISDNQKDRIPVFLQLDLPVAWEKTEVFESIDEMRLEETPDKNIRIKAISTDDCEILAEIAKKILYNVQELKSEVHQIMSTIISQSAIITSEHSEVGVSIYIPDETGKYFIF